MGIKIELNRLEGSVWVERRQAGNFDIDFGQGTLDPSPYGLMQSWGCAGRGGTNVGYFCDPRVDSLLGAGLVSRKDARRSTRKPSARSCLTCPPSSCSPRHSPSRCQAASAASRSIPTYLYSALWRWNPGPAN